MKTPIKSASAALTALLIVCLVGCWKDQLNVTLNADGSGSVSQTVTWSDRFVVGTGDGKGPATKTLPLTEDALRAKIGPALDITSMTFTDLPDGARRVHLEGKFKTPSQFFLSEYCRELCKLRLVSTGSDKVEIVFDQNTKGSGPFGENLSSLYGVAKGLYMKRTVQLPAEVMETNGELDQGDKKTVSWTFDLRNREGLERTKAFVEGEDKGRGIAVIPAAALAFAVPLKPREDSAKETSPDQAPKSPSASDLKVATSWVAWKKVNVLNEAASHQPAGLEIGLTLRWPEDRKPLAYYPPVLTHLVDDLGNDLMPDDGAGDRRQKIFAHRDEQELKVKAKSPDPKAVRLKKMAGHVKVVTNLHTERVVLRNIKELAGKDSTGNAVLDQLHFQIKSIKEASLRVSIDGGYQTISSIEMLKPDGSKLKYTGGMGGEETYTYDFSGSLAQVDRCELEVIVEEIAVTMPFESAEIDLP